MGDFRSSVGCSDGGVRFRVEGIEHKQSRNKHVECADVFYRGISDRPPQPLLCRLLRRQRRRTHSYVDNGKHGRRDVRTRGGLLYVVLRPRRARLPELDPNVEKTGNRVVF